MNEEAASNTPSRPISVKGLVVAGTATHPLTTTKSLSVNADKLHVAVTRGFRDTSVP